ncbi:hypothetical protein KAU33_08860 [Candidatus Dependentiae bacterium]|nr:hypothetical protein [Candidatus Dependentiae bacterium]
MEDDENKFEEEYQRVVNNSDKDLSAKLESSEAFLKSVNSLIEDWELVREAVEIANEKLRTEMKNEKLSHR